MHIRKVCRQKGDVYKVHVSVSGRYLTKSFARKADARKWGNEVEHKKDLDEICAGVNKINFDVYADEWISSHCSIGITPATRNRYVGIIKKYLTPYFGQTPLRKIDVTRVKALRTYCREKGFGIGRQLSDASVNRVLEVLRKMLNDAVSSRYINKNPLSGELMLRVPQKSMDYYGHEELSRFVRETADSPMYALYVLAAYSGMRKGELFALKPEDFDFDEGLIEVRRNFDFVSKKAVNYTKGKNIRHVGINREITSIVHGAVDNAVNSKWEYLFFPTVEAIPNSPTFNKRYFLKDLKKAGLRRIRFHDLRHSFASNFVMSGGDLFTLQGILGHQDYRTTQRYSHLSRSHFRDKINVLSLQEHNGRKVVNLKTRIS